jgi:hypothetical protein
MGENLEFLSERRRCLRQRVHAPAFASFDGVSGGMILDLSEGGLAMQMGGGFDGFLPGELALDRHSSSGRSLEDHSASFCEDHPLAPGRRVRMELELAGRATRVTESRLETTGYIAWADALGRAGVRFSELPEESRQRLNEWMTVHGGDPSHTAPKLALDWPRVAIAGAQFTGQRFTINLEPDAEDSQTACTSATVQSALRLIGERARALTRGTSAAIALASKGAVMCRASVGESAPALGSRLDVNSGLAGECFRAGKALRCDDAEHDPRVDLESCRRLGIRSIVAAPLRYERDTVGLLMVLAKDPFNFDEGDVAVVESLAHTVVRSMRQAELERGLAAG